MVTGSAISPLSDRFTRSTSSAWRSMDMFLWMMPIPPSRAMVIAIRLSVTVSMAAEMSGMASSIRLVRRVRRSVLAGQHRRAARHQQHVVEGEPLAHEAGVRHVRTVHRAS